MNLIYLYKKFNFKGLCPRYAGQARGNPVRSVGTTTSGSGTGAADGTTTKVTEHLGSTEAEPLDATPNT